MRSILLATPFIFASTFACAQEDLTSLTKQLADPSAEVRERAASALGALGRAALPARAALLRASADAHFKVRCASTQALARLEEPPAEDVLKRLVALLGDKSALVQAAAAEALAQLSTGDAALEPLTQLLAHRRWKVRAAALSALASAGAAAKSSLTKIEELATKDPSASVREAASAAAAQIRGADSGQERDQRFVGAEFRQGMLGLVVSNVQGRRALECGLVPGVALAQIDHHKITSRADLDRVLRRYAPRERVAIRVEGLTSQRTIRHTLAASDWPHLSAEPVTAEPDQDTPEAWVALLGETKREADWAVIAERLRPHLELVLLELLSKTGSVMRGEISPAGLAVFRALGADAVPGLRSALKDPNTGLGVLAAVALAEIGAPARIAAPQLLELAQRSDHWGERALLPAARVCGPTPGIKAVVAKRAAVRRVDPYLLVSVREELGAEALGDEVLGALIQHERAEVRVNTGRALKNAEKSSRANLATLTPAVLAALAKEDHAEARDELIGALSIAAGSEHAATTLPALVAALDSPTSRTAIDTLSEIGLPAVEPLAAVLESSDATPARRQGAARALARIAPRQSGALSPLLRLLRSENRDLHQQAGRGFGRAQGPGAEAGLKAIFELGNPSSVKTAIEGLVANPLMAERFETEILANLRSKDSEVQLAAAQAVGHFGLRAERETLRELWDAKPERSDLTSAILVALVALGPVPEDLDRYALALSWRGAAPGQALRGLWALGPAAVRVAPAVCGLIGGFDSYAAKQAEGVLVRIGPPALVALKAAVAAAKEASDPRLAALEAALAKLTSPAQPEQED